jgi:hypothetical protein
MGLTGATGPAGASGATGPLVLGFSTGDVKLTYKTAADAGFVMMNDGSIGDASSGASTRANADCVNLFTLFYNICADADVPIQTSAGAATTRAAQGAAATAWAAHCRLVLPQALGRELAVAGAGSGLTSRAIGSKAGAETHTQSSGELVAHSHLQIPTYVYPAVGDSSPGAGSNWASTTQNTPVSTTGGGAPMSILSPRAHLNIMVCL